MDESTRFVRDAHAAVRDLDHPRAFIYWSDFLLTISIAYASFAVYISDQFPAPVMAIAFVVSGLAMYRAVVFTHELAHQRAGALRAFRVVWNLLCGIPFLMPAFLYTNHQGHHTNDAYGTWADPEYLLRTSRWRLRVVAFMLLPLIYPLLPLMRFLILTPAAMLSPRVNRFVWRYGSSFLNVMNEFYRRDWDPSASSGWRWSQEVLCSIWAWTIVVLAITGGIPVSVIARTYLVFVFWMTVNQVRTLVSHHYTNTTQAPISYLDQVLDTNTFAHGRWLPHLWAPLGLRFHALHHLLPALPYHAMGTAHRRLLTSLPHDSPYHQTFRSGLWPVLRGVLRTPAGPPAMRR